MKTNNARTPFRHHYGLNAIRLGILIIVAALVTIPLYTAFSSAHTGDNVRTSKGSDQKKGSASKKTNNRSTYVGIGEAPSIPFLMLPQAPLPSVTILEGTCTTPESAFVLGNTVCARVTGGTDSPRRFVFVDPTGFIRQSSAITSDPQDITFQIPATQTSTVGDFTLDNRGTWKANMITIRSSVVAGAQFVVTDPAQPVADLSIFKSATNASVAAGSSSTFQIDLKSFGPNDAQNVVITDIVPANTTFGGMIQTAGPTFSCTTPAVGGTGTVTCNRSSLAAGDTASFDFAYQVNPGTPNGTTITNTVTVSSDTEDSNINNNSSSASSTVAAGGGGGGGTTCSVGCPDDIQVDANTTQGSEDGAIVHFSPPSGNDECGPIIVDHCNDCFFAVGITTVTASAATGESCSFTVTVNPPNTGNAAIVCPSNKTGTADSNCEAVINVGTPVVSGNNVTFHGVRSDGKPMYNCDCFPNSPNQVDDACNVNGACSRKNPDAPFSAGITTITWIAYTHDIPGPYATPEDEEAHRNGSASCTQTITVNDVTPPNIAATDSSASADASCQAPVPDYTTTVSDNCACSNTDTTEDCQGHPHFTVTQTPAPGTMVGIGPHTVHIEANDQSSNNGGAGNTSTKDITFTVNDTTAPVITCPANISNVPTLPGTCSAVVVTGTATATDNCDSTPTITGTRSDGQPLVALYPKGTTTITWRATDDAGNYSECTQTITVVDNEAPTITFNGQTPSMWPPNHSYHTFTAANFVASVSDNCDSLSVSDIDIISATSDEVENGAGDGDTFNDIVIPSGCKSIQLRAERQNNGDGRVYTITFRLRDSSGNVTTGTAEVYAPKNEGATPGDNGPHYTVTGSCP